MQSGAARNQTANLPISKWPAPPPELQPQKYCNNCWWITAIFVHICSSPSLLGILVQCNRGFMCPKILFSGALRALLDVSCQSLIWLSLTAATYSRGFLTWFFLSIENILQSFRLLFLQAFRCSWAVFGISQIGLVFSSTRASCTFINISLDFLSRVSVNSYQTLGIRSRSLICLISHWIMREQVSPDHETASESAVQFTSETVYKMVAVPKQLLCYWTS